MCEQQANIPVGVGAIGTDVNFLSKMDIWNGVLQFYFQPDKMSSYWLLSVLTQSDQNVFAESKSGDISDAGTNLRRDTQGWFLDAP